MTTVLAYGFRSAAIDLAERIGDIQIPEAKSERHTVTRVIDAELLFHLFGQKTNPATLKWEDIELFVEENASQCIVNVLANLSCHS